MSTFMNNLNEIKKCGKCTLLTLAVYISTIVLFPDSTWSQELTPKLSESEIKAVIPILKMEISGYDQLEKNIATEHNAHLELINGIKSGKIDPLEWLKQHSKYVIVPPGVVYQPACSRAASIAGWQRIIEESDSEVIANLRPNVQPTAIFTFGKGIRAINKNALIKRSKNIDISSENKYDINDPSYKEMRSILENARNFYSKNGFSADYDMSGDNIMFEPRDAEGEISGVIVQVYYDAFAPDFPDVMKNCASLPIGPTIEIKAGDKLMEKVFRSIEVKIGTDDENIKKSLRAAGITEDHYAEIKGALIATRANSEMLEEQEPEPLKFTPTTPEEKKAMQEYDKTVQIMKEEIRTKKNNIQIYKKYKADLDPILDILQKYMGGQ